MATFGLSIARAAWVATCTRDDLVWSPYALPLRNVTLTCCAQGAWDLAATCADTAIGDSTDTGD